MGGYNPQMIASKEHQAQLKGKEKPRCYLRAIRFVVTSILVSMSDKAYSQMFVQMLGGRFLSACTSNFSEHVYRTVWFEVFLWIRFTSGPPTVEGDFAEWWSLVVRTAPRQLRKDTSSVIMLTTWWIWKHRNAAVFDNARPSVTSLSNDIAADARLWADAGARGVRQLLP
ncbi:uncharacterized protein LOC124707763 [Lolium rigidum]|uniref:uncharacterized protein LOC124707763 n=1 Tax=Lolium rigidum TaxID=89674 RepID=UPI001F5CDAD4|nr:uncharacterized protein LOC124707763 [Lolium rigidum]XP_047095403.1 uncharacterized protein LOC124707763 [Lolium rigidum]XP_047095404.1 uncharacterized protein LOC124707763 [Lolium rigidum]XP_047095405.1 uncharacterized protein LOC124707763 [Lolium rigidum]XP_047095406.1 uncharacterized protein LOC124707763 [Lolium rigidum]XP_047095407.1 uncharacterized protein LOC124707763 [Lolium rigidum]XP_047095408.1 uncharacterized protein LOC124707763 [Lolium rigidum]